MRGRENPLQLRGNYICQWHDYSSIGRSNGMLRYLPFFVGPVHVGGRHDRQQ